jgi:signal peptidase I
MAGPYIKTLVAVALLIIGLYWQESLSVRQVPDEARLMEPSVRARSMQLFRTDPSPPARGTIVWFEHPAFPGRMLISRAVGLAGDRIALDDGRLVRNGAAVVEDYALRRVANETLEEILVPDAYVYVLNDARDDPMSAFTDSRRLGPIPVAAVVGKIPDPAVEKRAAAPPGRKGEKAGR